MRFSGSPNWLSKQTAVLEALVEKEDIAPEELMPSLIGQLDSQPLAWTLALCGEAARAQALADDLARKFPLDTMQNCVWLPLIRATLELNRGSAAGPEKALQLLQSARQYEPQPPSGQTWMRGQAQLQAKNAALGGSGVSKNHRPSWLGRALAALAAGAPRSWRGRRVAKAMLRRAARLMKISSRFGKMRMLICRC